MVERVLLISEHLKADRTRQSSAAPSESVARQPTNGSGGRMKMARRARGSSVDRDHPFGVLITRFGHPRHPFSGIPITLKPNRNTS